MDKHDARRRRWIRLIGALSRALGSTQTSSARHPVTKARPPRWLMIEGNCSLMLEWTATGILAFLLGLAGAGFYVRTVRRPTDRSGTHRRLR
jgi:hypothetical protein